MNSRHWAKVAESLFKKVNFKNIFPEFCLSTGGRSSLLIAPVDWQNSGRYIKQASQGLVFGFWGDLDDGDDGMVIYIILKNRRFSGHFRFLKNL